MVLLRHLLSTLSMALVFGAALVSACVFDTSGISRPPEPVCGNGALEEGETCDDGNDVGGDGCSASCQLETDCGDGNLDPAEGEVCDDGNTVDGDGCSGDCLSDESCGNTIVDAAVWEACDDGNSVDGDGCSADCSSDESCGNGIIDAVVGEVCDDSDASSGDGCNAICQPEPGWECEFEPSLCRPVCGDGFRVGLEPCDDGNTDDGDGCDSLCQVETGWDCTSGTCAPVCGDGVTIGGEMCDDGNTFPGDGCEPDCTPTLDCWHHVWSGHDYMFCQVPRTWPDANTVCTSMGYYLAKIQNTGENDWVTTTALSYGLGAWWIGANDSGLEGIWLWTDGSLVPSDFWAFGEPSNSGGNEDCAAILEATVPNYEWNDANCADLKSCICELQ